MRTIHKFPLEQHEQQVIEMHSGVRFLTAQIDQKTGEVCVWAEVDTDEEMVHYRFWIIGTGWPLPEGDQIGIININFYIGTVQYDGFVWHIYARQV